MSGRCFIDAKSGFLAGRCPAKGLMGDSLTVSAGYLCRPPFVFPAAPPIPLDWVCTHSPTCRRTLVHTHTHTHRNPAARRMFACRHNHTHTDIDTNTHARTIPFFFLSCSPLLLPFPAVSHHLLLPSKKPCGHMDPWNTHSHKRTHTHPFPSTV